MLGVVLLLYNDDFGKQPHIPGLIPPHHHLIH